MNREEKTAAIAELKELFAAADSIILTDTSGVTVNAIGSLRRKCRAEGITFRIAKNTLAKRALAGTPIENIADKFVGPTAFAIKHGDPVGPAKVICDYAKENKKFTIKWGLLGGSVLDPAGIEQLSQMKGKDELRSELLGLFNAPATQLLGIFSTMASQFVSLLQARADDLDKA
ncbi:MAG: 50S ribosomal protein L10 [Myxococcota bacterium]|jgi:large subunit ribosomal protein L10|nr:50S ribosomal protein L10 [Myxococcota bacterium]